MKLSLNDSVERLNGVGQQRAKLYKKLGVDTIYSLLRYFPRTYIDYTNYVDIADIIPNEQNVIKATVVKKMSEQRIRKGLSIFKATVADETGGVTITIFNNKYMFESLKEGNEYVFIGKITLLGNKRELQSPQFINAQQKIGLVPVYHLTEGLTNKMIQSNISQALKVWGDVLDDCIPAKIRQEYNLCQYRYAIENIHFPQTGYALKIARERLIFEELLILQIGLLQLKSRNRKTTTSKLVEVDIEELYKQLPFELTNGQINAINDSLVDMKKETPMNRLVQGDVGSGKTLVAAALCYACFKNKMQSAIMAPTEILAHQHYQSLKILLEPLGVKICLLTGSLTKKNKDIIAQEIANGTYNLVIGTHAIIQDNIQYENLGLVVTDEQHRFGVEQRGKLISKGENPHVLVMSATPIPRTLALIIYGDLDISVIKELPKGRQPIKTYSISSSKRERALGFIKKLIDEGRQAYIVCPLIEDSESDLISVNQYYQALQKTILGSYKIGLLHGKLRASEKDEIMSDFKQNKIQLLISTTVVEVGVDVPNAVVMMIENAERFGLSALHQLRGRVGRGEHQSHCILISDLKNENNIKRLKIMTSTNDGFKIANEDLKLRGPGDFFGQRQHGLPALKVASLLDDIEVLHKTQQIAREILDDDLTLSQPDNQGLKNMVKFLFSPNESGGFN